MNIILKFSLFIVFYVCIAASIMNLSFCISGVYFFVFDLGGFNPNNNGFILVFSMFVIPIISFVAGIHFTLCIFEKRSPKPIVAYIFCVGIVIFLIENLIFEVVYTVRREFNGILNALNLVVALIIPLFFIKFTKNS